MITPTTHSAVTSKVYVYFNIRRKKFSVMDNYKVVKHVDRITLKDCTFKVRLKGREKVLKTKQKNVHAFVIGTEIDYDDDATNMYRVYYNPYLFSSFVLAAEQYETNGIKQPIHKSRKVTMVVGLDGKACIYSEGPVIE